MKVLELSLLIVTIIILFIVAMVVVVFLFVIVLLFVVIVIINLRSSFCHSHHQVSMYLCLSHLKKQCTHCRVENGKKVYILQ